MRKKGLLGCSFPVLIILLVAFLAILVLGFLSGGLLQNKYGPTWLHVPSPAPELPPEALFNIGSIPITNTIITAWISILVILVLSFLAFRRPKMVPTGLQKVVEWAYGSLLSFCESVAGEKNGRRFFPFVATIFLFVITNAWLSLIPLYGNAIYVVVKGGAGPPLLRGANTDLNVTLAIALFAFFSIEYFGFRELGFFHYMQKFVRLGKLKHGFVQLFTGKAKSAGGTLFFGFIDLAVGILETLSEFIRIVSFSFRLFGNMMAGEILLLVTAFLVPMVLAVPFYGLEFFFSFIQALIFGGLTLIFMTVAVTSHEEEHE